MAKTGPLHQARLMIEHRHHVVLRRAVTRMPVVPCPELGDFNRHRLPVETRTEHHREAPAPELDDGVGAGGGVGVGCGVRGAAYEEPCPEPGRLLGLIDS